MFSTLQTSTILIFSTLISHSLAIKCYDQSRKHQIDSPVFLVDSPYDNACLSRTYNCAQGFSMCSKDEVEEETILTLSGSANKTACDFYADQKESLAILEITSVSCCFKDACNDKNVTMIAPHPAPLPRPTRAPARPKTRRVPKTKLVLPVNASRIVEGAINDLFSTNLKNVTIKQIFAPLPVPTKAPLSPPSPKAAPSPKATQAAVQRTKGRKQVKLDADLRPSNRQAKQITSNTTPRGPKRNTKNSATSSTASIMTILLLSIWYLV